MRHLLEISVWLDIKKTTLCCTKTQIYLLCYEKALVCLVGVYSTLGGYNTLA